MVRMLGAAIASALLLMASALHAPMALASDTWCDTDPPILITTPAGNTAVVYLVDSGPAEHLPSLLHPQVSYTAQSVDEGRATLVKMTVIVPNDVLGSGYSVVTEVWSGLARTGTRYDSESGTAGDPVKLVFRLLVP